MAVRWQRNQAGETTLEIEVSQQRVDRAFKRVFRAFRQRVQLPGFRRGKAPRQLVEAVVGKEDFTQVTSDSLVQESYREALREAQLLPLDEPAVEIHQFEEGKPLLCTITVPTVQVELADYRQIEVTQEAVTVTEEDVANFYDLWRDQHAIVRPADHDRVQDGDWVVLELRVSHRGTLVEEYPAHRPLRFYVGRNSLNPPLDLHVLGMAKGQERVVLERFPEDHPNQALAGQMAEFDLKVLDILDRVLPAEEQFVKSVSDAESPAALKERIAHSLHRQRTSLARSQAAQQLMDKVIEQSIIDIPEDYLQEKVEDELEEVKEALAARQAAPLPEEELRHQVTERVRRELQEEFVLRSVIQQEEIEASENDLLEEAIRLAEANNMTVEVLMQRLRDAEQLPLLKENAERRLALRAMLEAARVVEVAPPPSTEPAAAAMVEGEDTADSGEAAEAHQGPLEPGEEP